jgi:hypothetical protein
MKTDNIKKDLYIHNEHVLDFKEIGKANTSTHVR